MIDAALPAIALVQASRLDANAIESSLRSAGMRNPIVHYDIAEAFIGALAQHDTERAPSLAVAIVESDAWKRLAIWRDADRSRLLPVIVTFDHAHELKEFSQARALHAAGTLKPFAPKELIRLLEPLQCRWLLMNPEGSADAP